MGREYKRRIPVKDEAGTIVYYLTGEETTEKRFRTEEEYRAFRDELALTARKKNGFEEAVKLEQMKPIPDKLGLLLLRKIGKLWG